MQSWLVSLRRLFTLLVTVTFLFASFVSANHQGISAAQRQWTNSPHSHLVFKSTDHQQYEPTLVKANDEHHLCLLTQTKDLIVVFDRRTATKPPGHVFVVARTDIASVLISP